MALHVMIFSEASAVEINLALSFDATASYSESVIMLAGVKSGKAFILNTANSRMNAPEWRKPLEGGHVDVI